MKRFDAVRGCERMNAGLRPCGGVVDIFDGVVSVVRKDQLKLKIRKESKQK